MNELLQEKLSFLEKADDFECWYLVKQPTDFLFWLNFKNGRKRI